MSRQASLCGHYEIVELLLESGALCERDTFQGERCLYNALNDRIRNLLLSYDFSKSTNPLQPFAAHITSLLARRHPITCDISLICGNDVLRLHKFVLVARSQYFARKLATSPEISSLRLPNTLPIEAITSTVRFIYLSELSPNLGDNENEVDVLRGMDKFSRLIEVDRLFEIALNRENRRFKRQRMSDEITRGRDEIHSWFIDNVLPHRMVVDSSKVNMIKWNRSNSIFADVLIRADEPTYDESNDLDDISQPATGGSSLIPIGPSERNQSSDSPSQRSVLFPVHKAMLIRSDYFLTMFSSSFLEAQQSDYLQIVSVDCSPDVLEVILTFLYSEKADFSLDIAIEVLFTADLLLLEKLKLKASTIISSFASGVSAAGPGNSRRGDETEDEDLIDIYEVVRAGWAVRVRRLEEFGARYIAQRLEKFIDDEEFAILVKESAERVKDRQETDTIELIDDIRYYLSERYRLRFEDAGLEEMMENGIADLATTDEIASDDLHLEGDQQNITGLGTVIRTLDGDEVDDEFEEDARLYQTLMAKLDNLLEHLNLDA
jgi:ankyrin repeat and BTB/POZ domain-containing protein 1